MQNATQLARMPPIVDFKRRSDRSSVFKAIKKSFSTITLSSVFRKHSHVSTSNIYGDIYSLDVAPSDVFERMLRDDLRTAGLGDRTPYNNGAIHDLHPDRSAFHLSPNYRLNASTIPTLFIATDPKVTPQLLLSGGSSPLRSQLPIPDHSPHMAEAVKGPVAFHPVSLAPGHRAAPPSSTLPHAARLSQPSTLHSLHSLQMNNVIKNIPDQPLSASPTQQWFDQFHARVDYIASSSTSSIESRRPVSPDSPKNNDSRLRKISYTSMSVALSTRVTDLERRYVQCYGQNVLGDYHSKRDAVYLETPSLQKSGIMTSIRCIAVANLC